MVDHTPNRPFEGITSAQHTRPQEAETPTNLNRRSLKKARHLDNLPPPRIGLLQGGGALDNEKSAFAALSSQLDAYENEAKTVRAVCEEFSVLCDKFVASYTQPGPRKVAHDITGKVVKIISTALFAESGGEIFAPLRVRSQISDPTTTTTTATSSGRSVTFAEVAGRPKTLTNSGVNAMTPRSSLSGKIPTSSAGGVSLGSQSSRAATPPPKKDDKRLLVTLATEARLHRPEVFLLRQELCRNIKDLTLASIPLITPTSTGWAITPSNDITRDLLLTEENMEIMRRVLGATAVSLPEKWYNYAVAGVPHTMRALLDKGYTTTGRELVEEEVIAQTQVKPVDCRPARNGPDLATGRITWIVSFREPVRAFRLFNTSSTSKLIEKRAPIIRHTPGCQGWCNPAKCTRYARCSNCSQRIDQHVGATGANCTEQPRCANCHGPFPAGHAYCPAEPKRRNGKVIKPTKKQLDAIRRHGDKEFRDAQATTATEGSQDTTSQTQPEPSSAQQTQLRPQAQGPIANAKTTGPKRKHGARITEYEAAGPKGITKASGKKATRIIPPQTPSRITAVIAETIPEMEMVDCEDTDEEDILTKEC